jgi:hypothetical protein
MSSPDYRRIEGLYREALTRDGEARARFLREACAGAMRCGPTSSRGLRGTT